MSEDIREEIARAWVEFTHTKPEDANEWWFHDGERLADALMPLVARIQAQALREAADAYRSGQLTGVFYGRDDYAREWLRARADRLEQGDPS